MAHTGAAVNLLLDTGHLVFAGGDNLQVGQKNHGHRINHVHAGDIRADVLAAVDKDEKPWTACWTASSLSRVTG